MTDEESEDEIKCAACGYSPEIPLRGDDGKLSPAAIDTFMDHIEIEHIENGWPDEDIFEVILDGFSWEEDY